MKKYKCPTCGYECDERPDACPVCGTPGSKFIETE